ncbi:MAG: patatin-like phospholipase family protein [Rubripirellula sp.]
MNLVNLFRPPKPKLAGNTAKRRKAVIALGGGGARGLAHLGAVQAIGESEVQTERIVGVSMGSLVGALCASEPDITRVISKSIQLLHSPIFQRKQKILFGAASPEEESFAGIFSWYGRVRKYLKAHRKLTRAVTSPSLMSDEPLQESIAYLLPDIDLQDLPIPLSIVAVDLLSGQRVVLEKGPLRKAVQASAAIPGIFPAVPWDDMLLSDIGVIESIPTVVAQAYASDLTIAVDVGQNLTQIDKCNTAIEVLMRVDDICERLMRRQLLEAADVLIQPNVGSCPWFDFTHPEHMINEGHKAGHIAMAALRVTEAA